MSVETTQPSVIVASVYRGLMVCRKCVAPKETMMVGQFFDQHGVRGSGWTCDRCGIELEHQDES